MKYSNWIARSLALAFLLPLPSAFADLGTFQWSTTYLTLGISGTANFSVVSDPTSGFDLVIVLTNTATQGPVDPGQILSGLAWNMTGASAAALKMVSANATDGTIAATNNVVANVGTNICAPGFGGTGGVNPGCAATITNGWEAAYSSGAINGTWAPSDHWGIGTTGLGVYNGSSVGQNDYGLVPTAGVGSGANGGVTGHFPYTYESATFTLSGLTTSNITINNVVATYGTLPEATPAATLEVSATPEPSTFSAMGAAALFLAFGARRLLRRSA